MKSKRKPLPPLPIRPYGFDLGPCRFSTNEIRMTQRRTLSAVKQYIRQRARNSEKAWSGMTVIRKKVVNGM